MAKYFDMIREDTNLSRNMGAALFVSSDFQVLVSTLIAQCTYLQNLIQQIIYTSHGSELISVKKSLKSFPSPKSRFNFLCKFPYTEQDHVLAKVFDFARSLFEEIYEIRNVLAHEVWASSEQYRGAVMFSSLDEDSRLLMASSRVWHDGKITPKEIHDATIRFIRNVKIVTADHLELAISDANICSWALMNISNVLNEEDSQRKEDARQAFFVFGGTSHLFDTNDSLPESTNFSASRNKTITGN